MVELAEEIGKACWWAAYGRYVSLWRENDFWATAKLFTAIRKRGHTHTVPNISQYLQGILLEADNAPTNRPTWSAASMRPKITKNLSARYLALHSVFKLEIISFLCELAVQTKVIRDHFEQSSLALSKCRNDQLAAKRDLAKMYACNRANSYHTC